MVPLDRNAAGRTQYSKARERQRCEKAHAGNEHVYLGPITVKFLHDRAVTELLDQAVLALDRGVRDFGHLPGTELIPTLVVDVKHEVDDGFRVLKVDEGIPDVAIILEVNAQIDKVVLAKAGAIYELFQVWEVHLVGNVTKHDLRKDN